MTTEERKETVVQEIIKYIVTNSYNIESQSGENSVVVNYEEIKLHFSEWIEKEKSQTVKSIDKVRLQLLEQNYNESGHNYFCRTFITIPKKR